MGTADEIATDRFRDRAPRAEARPSAIADADAPAGAAIALAAGHLIAAAADAHRNRNHADVARRLGVSRARVSRLSSLTGLAPEIQGTVLGLRSGGSLGRLSERTLHEVVAVHADWCQQRWWWSLLAQPLKPSWLSDWLPARAAFPSGVTYRAGDQGLGDLSLSDLTELVDRRRGGGGMSKRREALLVALAGGTGAAPPPKPEVVSASALRPAQLSAEFKRIHGHHAPSRQPDFLRRRVAWAVQASKEGGLPKPISGRVIELRDALPEPWREVFAGLGRVHVTRAHRIERPHRAGHHQSA